MSVTLGTSGGSQVTFNYDAVFATSLANYRGTLVNNISSSNAFFNKIKESDMWESADGGTHIVEDLMYALAEADSYDGYDELSTAPTDGITQAQFQWRQAAIPVVISGKEEIQNKHRIINLLESKIQQAEMGFQEYFAKTIMQGSYLSGGTDIESPRTSPFNGSSSFDTLPLLCSYAPTVSKSIGNLDQSSYSWWQNRTKTSAATTYSGLLAELDNLRNTCSRGPGGPPDFALCDQTTYELINQCYYYQYRRTAESDSNYPFENIKFKNTVIFWDEWVPNVYAGTTDTTTTTGGTFYFLNSKFLKVRYEGTRDFVTSEFKKPINQDAKVAHILWMGQTTINQRRKQGVLGKIARTLTAG